MRSTSTGVTHGEQVCIAFFTFTFDPTSPGPPVEEQFESGCAFDTGTVSFDALTSATLDATTVTVELCDQFGCDPSTRREITVIGQWVAFGPTQFQKSRSVFDDGVCSFADAFKATFRQASFSGVADGTDLTADFAGISDGKFTFRSSCPL